MEEIEIEDFVGVLIGDVNKCHKILIENDTQANRRNLVRAVFAAIEGLSWRVRTDLARQQQRNLHYLELAAMREETYSVSPSGKLQVSQKFLPLQASLRLTISLIKRFRPNYSEDFSHQGWSNLLAAIELRNRLVHPKSLQDLSVNEKDINRALTGFYWILALIIKVLQESIALLEDQTAEAKKVASLLEPAGRKAFLKVLRGTKKTSPKSKTKRKGISKQ
ncbi:MAG: hypothetical protein KGO53_11025 [Alphaproteobacteria bacterium]|nr:hypothetical protein [Alphaproteobacteria bacterium]